jgi:hypothetical protein
MLEFTKCSSFRISLTVGVSKNALSRANGLDVEGLINATGAPERSWTTAPVSTVNVMQVVRDGEADVGVAFQSSPVGGVHVQQRIVDPLRAILKPGQPLCSKNELVLEDLAAYPIANAGLDVRHSSGHGRGVPRPPAATEHQFGNQFDRGAAILRENGGGHHGSSVARRQIRSGPRRLGSDTDQGGYLRKIVD